jgi:hypothetical protein
MSRWLFFCTVVFVAGCGSTEAPRSFFPDGSAGKVAADARTEPGTIGTLSGHDAADLAPQRGDIQDARPDRGADGPDASSDPMPPRTCSAGHSCTGNARCQRACLGGQVYRCTCAEGHLICTGCISVDGGAPDVRGGPGACASGVAHGRRCDTAGSVCEQPSDGGQKLCACGNIGPNRLWICQ